MIFASEGVPNLGGREWYFESLCACVSVCRHKRMHGCTHIYQKKKSLPRPAAITFTRRIYRTHGIHGTSWF